MEKKNALNFLLYSYFGVTSDSDENDCSEQRQAEHIRMRQAVCLCFPSVMTKKTDCEMTDVKHW